jgi:hypothetical protein
MSRQLLLPLVGLLLLPSTTFGSVDGSGDGDGDSTTDCVADPLNCVIVRTEALTKRECQDWVRTTTPEERSDALLQSLVDSLNARYVNVLRRRGHRRACLPACVLTGVRAKLGGPAYCCPLLAFSHSLSLTHTLSLFLSLCFSLSVSLSVCLSLSLGFSSFCLSLSISLYLFISLYLDLSLSLSLSALSCSLSLSLCFSLSLSLAPPPSRRHRHPRRCRQPSPGQVVNVCPALVTRVILLAAPAAPRVAGP